MNERTENLCRLQRECFVPHFNCAFSRSSLLSSGDDGSYVGGWSEPAAERRVPRPGKFLYERSSSTSNLIGTFQTVSFGSSEPPTSLHHRTGSFSIVSNEVEEKKEEEEEEAGVTMVAKSGLTMPLDGEGRVEGSEVNGGRADDKVGGELLEKKMEEKVKMSRPRPLEDRLKNRPRPLEVKSTIRQRAMLFGGTKI